MRKLAIVAAGVLLWATAGRAVTVFETDFESGLPGELSAPGATIEGVQGYEGLGAPGRQFGGSFLRYASTDVLDTQLTLTGLPPHDRLSLGFLLGVIDSWDGIELFEVLIDGAVVFSESFELALSDTSSYVAPPGALLSSGTDLGFSAGGYYDHDRAYDLSVDPAFLDVPHTADTVTIVWRLNAVPGGGASFWQGGTDESWAIDGVTVAVESGTTTSTLATSTTTVSSTTTTAVSSTTSTSLPGDTALLTGAKLLLRDKPGKPSKRAIGLVSHDGALTLAGGNGSSADPVLHGGALRVVTDHGDGFDDTYPLPAERWRYVGKEGAGKGYKLRRTTPFKSVLVKPGKVLKVVAKGSALGHSLGADPRPVAVELRLGTARYCLAFGGTVDFKPGTKLLAKAAPAPAGCPPAAP